MGNFISANMRLFAGLAKEAESTILPPVTTYIQESFSDTPECKSPEDHGVILWCNLPGSGVLSVHRYQWIITAISNLLASYRRNGICILVHANRGQVAERIGYPKLVGKVFSNPATHIKMLMVTKLHGHRSFKNCFM